MNWACLCVISWDLLVNEPNLELSNNKRLWFQ
jgi:hypothetical protein